jgi:transcription termination/antitermination protein NusG
MINLKNNPNNMTTKSKSANTSYDTTDEEFILIDSMKPRWYVLQTYVGFEDAVKRLIEQKIENLTLQDKILEIYIPTKKIIKLDAKGNRKEKEEKIYPGYIYINMLLDREVGYTLQNTPHVSRIASTGNIAVPLEEGYIENLKEKLVKESLDIKSTNSNIKYRVDDVVEIIDGPFKDMSGKICGIDPQNSKITVLLSIFERETEVIFDVLEIKKVI